MKSEIAILSFLLFAVFLPGCINDPTVPVEIQVIDEKGAPVDGASVSALSNYSFETGAQDKWTKVKGTIEATAKTGKGGKTTMQVLPGNYAFKGETQDLAGGEEKSVLAHTIVLIRLVKRPQNSGALESKCISGEGTVCGSYCYATPSNFSSKRHCVADRSYWVEEEKDFCVADSDCKKIDGSFCMTNHTCGKDDQLVIEITPMQKYFEIPSKQKGAYLKFTVKFTNKLGSKVQPYVSIFFTNKKIDDLSIRKISEKTVELAPGETKIENYAAEIKDEGVGYIAIDGKAESEPILIFLKTVNDTIKDCGAIKYIERLGACENNVFYPSLFPCLKDSDCKLDDSKGCFRNVCLTGNFTLFGTPQNFPPNKGYKLAFLPIYLDEIGFSKKNEVSQGFSEAINWFDKEKKYWNSSSAFSVSSTEIGCKFKSLQDYTDAVGNAKNALDPNETESIQRKSFITNLLNACQTDLSEYDFKFVVFVGGASKLPSFINRGYNDSQGNMHTIANGGKQDMVIYVHEMLHNFGLPDLYNDSSKDFHLDDCFFMGNSVDSKFAELNEKHLCSYEAKFMGFIK